MINTGVRLRLNITKYCFFFRYYGISIWHHCGHRKIGFDSFLTSTKVKGVLLTLVLLTFEIILWKRYDSLIFKQYFRTCTALHGEICWHRATFLISWNSVTHFQIDFESPTVPWLFIKPLVKFWKPYIKNIIKLC